MPNNNNFARFENLNVEEWSHHDVCDARDFLRTVRKGKGRNFRLLGLLRKLAAAEDILAGKGEA